MTIFRKSALIFIVVVALLTGLWIYVVRNGLIERTAETALERMFEAPVEISGLALNPFTLQAGFQRLRIANADRPERWLIDAGPAAFDVNLAQLFGKKLVLREVSLQNVSVGTDRPEGKGVAPRPKSAPEPTPGPAAQPPADAKVGGKQDGAPVDQLAEEASSLSGILPDTDLSALTKDVNVDQLMKGRKLASLDAVNQTKDLAVGRVKYWQDRMSGTTIPQDLRTVERDTQALRFNVKNPNDLKVLQGDLQSLKKRLEISQKELKGLNDGWKQDQKGIKAGWDSVSTATEDDIKTLRGAAKLPNLDASQIGKTVFGGAAVAQFNSMLGYARMAQKALKSDKAKPQALPRRSGRWVAYPVTARVYPGFALERSVFSGALTDNQGQPTTRFEGKMLGLASDAMVYGAPLTITWLGTTQNGRHWTADALFDQRDAPTKTSIVIRGAGISMGTVDLSESKDGLYPQRMDIPQADVEMSFKLTGSALAGGLSVVARKVVFQFAPGEPAKGEMATAVRGMFADFQNVEMKGTLGGTLAHPKFDLSTSIDKILSDRLKALVGKRVAEIDRQIRAAVDGQVAPARASAESAVAAQQAKLEQTLGEMDQRSTQVQQTLEQRAKQAEAELKKSTERVKKEAESGAKKALEGKTKNIKPPKR